MYTKYSTNTKIAKLSPEYLNGLKHSYKSNKKKPQQASITKTLIQRNVIQNEKSQGVNSISFYSYLFLRNAII